MKIHELQTRGYLWSIIDYGGAVTVVGHGVVVQCATLFGALEWIDVTVSEAVKL